MKNFKLKASLTIAAAFVVSFAFAQTSTVSETSQKNANHSLSNHREDIQKVIKTEEKGVIRGYDFGTPVSEVKKTETGEYVADGKDFAIYKVSLAENEYAEIIYYLDAEQKIKGFGIEFIITENNYKLEENIVLDFQQYFTERYGKYSVNARNDEVWDAGSYTVEMGDSSEGGSALEIEIEIFPKETTTK